jgi:hypothetical protein
VLPEVLPVEPVGQTQEPELASQVAPGQVPGVHKAALSQKPAPLVRLQKPLAQSPSWVQVAQMGRLPPVEPVLPELAPFDVVPEEVDDALEDEVAPEDEPEPVDAPELEEECVPDEAVEPEDELCVLPPLELDEPEVEPVLAPLEELLPALEPPHPTSISAARRPRSDVFMGRIVAASTGG